MEQSGDRVVYFIKSSLDYAFTHPPIHPYSAPSTFLSLSLNDQNRTGRMMHNMIAHAAHQRFG